MTQRSRVALAALFALGTTTALQGQQGILVQTVEDREHVAIMTLSGTYSRQPEGNREYEVAVRRAVAKEFFRTHTDDYDFLAVFTGFDYNLATEAEGEVGGRYYAIKNDTQGIGQEIFDLSSAFGSAGRLQGYIDVGPLATLVTDPTDPRFEHTLSLFAHELGHRWGSRVRMRASDGNPSEALLGRGKAHWSFLLQSHNSVMYGNDWRDNGDGTFTSVGRTRSFYSPLDLYLMGVLDASEVPPFFLLDAPGVDPTRLSEIGVTITATRRELTIDDVIAIEGDRMPAAADAQKRFKTAFIFLLRPGEQATDGDLRAINTVREAFSTRTLILTGGRAIVEAYAERPVAMPTPPPIVPPSSGQRTGPSDLLQGTDWLLARQRADGAWADARATEVRDTAAALELFKEIPSTFMAYEKGLAWLAALDDFANVDTASRRLVAIAPQFSALDASFLADARNPDGGWGLGRGYRSDVFDTALAASALPNGDAAAAIAYLVANQNSDGGWSLRPNSPSSIQATFAVLRLAERYASTPLGAAIANGMAWLQAQQHANGSFGESGGTVYDTAQAVLALARTPFSRQDLARATEYLRNAQLADGSWNGSVYQTALAIRALKTGELPNLAVRAPLFSPTNPVEDDDVRVSAVVMNTSVTDIHNVVVRFSDGDPAGGGAAIGADVTIPLLPALSELEVSVGWLDTTPPGDHAIFARVDPDGQTEEFNEGDNQASASIAVRPPPLAAELVVRAAQLTFNPPTLRAVPQAQTLTAIIANVGRTAATAVDVRVYDGDPDAGGPAIASALVDVPERGTSSVAFTFDITTAGDHRYYVVVDPQGQVPEADETNNRASSALPVDSTLDFFVAPASVTLSQNPIPLGQTLTVSAQVGNSGTTGAFAVPVRFVIDHPDGAIEIATIAIDLAAGESKTVTATWRTSRTLNAVPVTVSIDPQNTVPETSEANNSASAPLSVPPSMQANLRVTHTELTVTSPVLQAGAATISIPVHNNGFASATGVAVTFYLGVPGNGGVALGPTQMLPPIAAGAEALASIEWTNIAVFGSRLIYVAVDEANTVDEFDEDDNRTFLTIDILSLPDLAVSGGALTFEPPFPKSGDSVSFAAAIRNLGEQPALNVLVRFVAGPAAGGAVIGEQTLPQVAPGATATAQIALPGAAPDGAATFSVIVDPLGAVAELSETNNTASRTLGVQDASLWFSNLYFSPNGDEAQDRTELFFRLDGGRTAASVTARNREGDAVRTFDLETPLAAGSAAWDGLDTLGRVVPDGEYSFVLNNTAGDALATARVVVDNNASPVGNAFGTKYLLQNNLTCTVAGTVGAGTTSTPFVTAGWLPDDAGLVKYFPTQAVCSQFSSFTCQQYAFAESPVAGVYVITPEGQSTRITPDSWRAHPPLANGTQIFNVSISPDGSRMVISLLHYRLTFSNRIEYVGPREFWVVNSDGSGLRLAATIPMTAVQSGSIEALSQVIWAPDSLRFAVAGAEIASGYRLYIAHADGSAQTLVDNISQVDVTWTPDSSRLFYLRGANVFAFASDGSSPPSDLFEPIGIGFNALGFPSQWTWLSPDHFVSNTYDAMVALQRLRLFSTDGAPAQIVDESSAFTVSAAPAGRAIAYASRATGQPGSNNVPERIADALYVLDAGGAPRRLHTAAVMNRGISDIRWSQDGQHVAFIEEITTEHKVCQTEGAVFCGKTYLALNRVDLRSGQVDTHAITEPATRNYYDSLPLTPIGLFPDGSSYLFHAVDPDTASRLLVAVNPADGAKATIDLGTLADLSSARFSASGKYFLYRVHVTDPLQPCWKGYFDPDDWILASLLNLTAQFSFQRDGAQLMVRGIAEDRNFSSYVLEYAPVDAPTAWSPIGEASDVPAINETLARWIPPDDGTFYVRLTAFDKAGNRLQVRKRITWGLVPSITNVSVSPRLFSPNGDGARDTTTVDYLVLGPVHLSFQIYDESERLMRTILQDHDTIGPASIAWDGRDEAGQFVADGRYRIHVLDYDFFVTIDRTPPAATLGVTGAYHVDRVLVGLRVIDVVAVPHHNVDGRALDANLERWVVESGIGSTPAEWLHLVEGTDPQQKRLPSGAPVVPVMDTTIARLGDLDAAVGRRFRLRVEDRAGNRTVVSSNVTPAEMVVYLWDDERIPIAEPVETKRGAHVLAAVHTSATPLVSVQVQYRQLGTTAWTNGPFMSLPAPRFELPWDTTALPAGKTHEVRLAGLDTDGRAVLSNVFAIHSDLFEMIGYDANRSMTLGAASLRETEVVVRLVEALPGEREIGKNAVTVTTETNFEIAINPDPANRTCIAREVPARYKGVGASGRIYYSNVRNVFVPPTPSKPCGNPNPTAVLRLTAQTRAAAACGLPAPGLVDITLIPEAGTIFPASQTLAIQETPNGPLREVPVTSLPFTMTLDTSTRPEGQYIVRATWLDRQDGPVSSAVATFIVDRQPATARITYPAPNQVLCPVRMGERFVIPIEGEAQDPNFDHYELEYGFGDAPQTWLPFFPRMEEIDTSRTPKTGVLANFDVGNLPGGTYTVRLKVYDQGGNLTCRTVTFTLQAAMRVDAVTVDVPLFSPNGDDRFDSATISYAINRTAFVGARVYAMQNGQRSQVPVRTLFVNAQQLEGVNSVIWDGFSDAAVRVPDGDYVVVVSATDPCGNAASGEVRVRVDATLPAAVITSPSPGADVGVVAAIRGSVDDLHFVSYLVEAGAGAEPITWTPVAAGFAPVADGLLGTWKNDGAAGMYSLRVTARDRAGNERETRITVRVPDLPALVTSVSVDPPLFSPNGDGRLDTSTVTVDVGTAARLIVDVVDAADQVVKRLGEGDALPGSSQPYQWNGLNASGQRAPDGEYRVRLQATSAADPNRTQTEHAPVRVDTTPPSVVLDAPVTNLAHLKGAVAVTGTASDATLDTYTVSYGTAATGADTTLDEGRQSRTAYAFGQLSGLSDGEYIVKVAARDLAGNAAEQSVQITLDNVAPVPAILAPVGGAVLGGADAAATVRAGVEEQHVQQWQLRLGVAPDPATWTELASGTTLPLPDPAASWLLGSAVDGDYVLSLTASDKAGSIGEVRTNVSIDRTAPIATISQPAEGAHLSAAAVITGTATDAHLHVTTLEIGDGPAATAARFSPLATLATPVTDGALGTMQGLPPDGTYTLRLTVEDQLGLKSVALRAIRIDTEPPPAPVDLRAVVEARSNARLNWTASTEPELAGYHVYRDGIKVTATPVAATMYLDAGLTDGVHRYTVTAVDRAALESTRSNEANVQIDLTPPATRILTPSTGSLVSGIVDVRGTASAADDFKEYRVYLATNGGPSALIRRSPQPIIAGVLTQHDTITNAENASLTIRLEAEDLSGNTASDEVTVTVDNVPPAAPVLVSATATASDVDVSWQANNEADLAGYLLYNGDVLANARRIVTGSLSPYIIPGTTFADRALADGTYKYLLAAIDKAGNISDPSNALTVEIDTRAPRATITQPANGSKTDRSIALVATTVDLDIERVQFQVKLATAATWIDLGAPDTTSPYGVTWDTTGIEYGTYQFRAVATDTHQHTDAAPPVITIVYQDLTPTDAPTALTAHVNGGDVALSWTAVQAADLAGYVVYRRVGAAAPVRLFTTPIAATTFTDAGVADGSYLYDVRAVDTSTNESAPSNAAPARVYRPTLTATVACVATPQTGVNGSGAEPGSTVTLFLDTGMGPVEFGTTIAAADGSFAFDPVPLVAGTNLATARAVDGAGNISRVSASLALFFGTIPVAPSGLAATVNGSNVALTWNAVPGVFTYMVYRDGVPITPAGGQPVPGTASASSSYFNSQPASNAIDGLTQTFWRPHIDDTAPTWEIAFAQSTFVKQVRLDWVSNTLAARDLDLQRWTGSEWVTAFSVRNSFSAQQVLTLPQPLVTTRLRLRILTGAQGLSNLFLAEVRVLRPAPILGTAFTDFSVPNGRHTYAVRAVSFCAVEGDPAEIEVPIGDVVPPAAVVDLTASVALSDVTLQWSASLATDLAGYGVYRRDGSAWLRLNPATITATTFLDASRPNGTYSYRVTAFDAAGNEGPPSNEATAIVDVPPPAAPIALTVSEVAQGGALDLAWSAGDPARLPAGYRIGRSLTAGGPYQQLGGLVAGTSHRDTGLTNGITYFYVVTAVDAAGNASAGSNEASGTPHDTVAPAAPVLRYPTDAGHPITVSTPQTSVGGTADRGAAVTLLQQGLSLGTTTALETATRESLALPGTSGGTQAFHASGLVALQLRSADFSLISLAITNVLTGETTTYDDIQQPSEFAFSPDGQYVAYHVFDGGFRVRLFDRAAGAVAQSFDVPAAARRLAFSPDGARIAMGMGSALWSLTVATGQLTQLATNFSSGARWSPSAQHIVFNASFNQLRLLELGTGVVRVVSNLGTDGSFSPDGNTFVFAESTGLRLYDVATGAVTPLVVPAQAATSPMFSPDGRHIAYVAQSSGGPALHVFDVATGADELLLVGGTSSAPQWAVDQSIVQLGSSIQRTLLPGRFWFDDVALDPGLNQFSAVAADDAGNTSVPADPIAVTFDASAVADLAVAESDVFVHPIYARPGDRVTIAATVHNVGGASASEVSVLFLVSPEDGSTIEVVSAQTIAAIGAGAEAAVSASWNTLGKSGKYRISVVVDHLDRIAEAVETNNRATRDAFVNAEDKPFLTVKTDNVTYAPDSIALVTVEVSNPGASADFALTVRIEDAQGFAAGTLLDQTLPAFGSSTRAFALQWPTGGVVAGSYRARAVLTRQPGSVTEAAAPFAVEPQEAASATLVTNRASYSVGDAVELRARIRNTSLNADLGGLVARVKVRDAQGIEVFSHETTIPVLLLNTDVQLTANWVAPAAGSYTATLVVSSPDRDLATAVAAFAVTGSSQIEGSLDVAPAIVAGGEPVSVHATVRNTGTASVSNHTLSLLVVDTLTRAPADVRQRPLDLSPGASSPWDVSLDTTLLARRSYSLLLQLQAPGATETLATATFTVADRQAPVVAILTPVSGTFFNHDVAVMASARDDATGVARVELQASDGSWSRMTAGDPVSGTHTYLYPATAATEGSRTLRVRAADQAGNDDLTSTTDANPAAITVIIDVTAPSIAITGVDDGATYTAPVTPVIAIADAYLASQQTLLDGAPFISGSTVGTPGTHLLEATATDHAGNSAVRVAAFTIATNAPPVGHDMLVELDEDATAAIRLDASDPNGDQLSFVVSAPAHGRLEGTPPDLLYTPNADFFGDDAFTFTASDGVSTTPARTVTIRVLAVNDRPVASAGRDQTVSEGDRVVLDGSGSADIDDTALIYEWTQLTGPPVVLMTGSDAARREFIAPAVPRDGATLSFRLVVSDGRLDSVAAITNVLVKNVNHPPVADAGDDQHAKEGATVTLSGADSYDPDNDSTTFRWVQTAGPAVALSSPNTSTTTFVVPPLSQSTEVFTFELTVSDGEASASDAVSVTVARENHRPVANAGPDQTVQERTSVRLDGRGSSDLDHDSLTYGWRQLSGSPVFLSDASSSTSAFTAPDVGPAGASLVFELVVHDGFVASAPDTVTVQVNNVGTAPVCSAARADTNVLWPPNHRLVRIRIDGVTTDGGPGVRIVQVTQDEPVDGLGDGDTSPDAVIENDTVLLRAERSGNGNGRVYRVSFTATDRSGLACSGAVTVTVPHSPNKSAVDSGQQYDSTSAPAKKPK